MKLAHLIEERKDEKLPIVPLPSEQEMERRQEAVKVLRGQELYEQRIAEMKGKIQKEAKTDEDMKRLQTVAGVGPIVAVVFQSVV